MPTGNAIRAGDVVEIPFGASTVLAKVIEDRGYYGDPPVQIIRVSWMPTDALAPEEFEVSARDVISISHS